MTCSRKIPLFKLPLTRKAKQVKGTCTREVFRVQFLIDMNLSKNIPKLLKIRRFTNLRPIRHVLSLVICL